VQVVLNSVEEKFLDCIWRVIGEASLLIRLSNFLSNFCDFISSIEVRNAARAKLIVNIFKE
jgi:hypothetical protein